MQLKIVFFITVISVSNVFAASVYSQVAKVSLDMENKTLEQVMDEIEQQSEFYFIFNQKQIDVSRVVDIKVEDKLISDILPELLKGTDVHYFVLDRKILLTKDPIKENFPSDKSGDEEQQNVVSGKVSDINGAPLPGVNVLIKGTLVGVITDVQGNYMINAPVSDGILVFSFIGYTTREASFAGTNTVNIQLEEELTALNEVVVTALGIKREARSLGYSTATVDNTQLTVAQTGSVGTGLVGKVSGLDVSSAPSGVGGSSKIRIRGQSSFGADNSPLVVVNGVPIESAPGGFGRGKSDTGDGLQSINPEDIESMSVLKGAAAAVLYGSRAKDGVILITTKTGSGQTGIGIEISSSVQVDRAIDYSDFQYEYGLGENGLAPTTAAAARNSGTWSFGARFDTMKGVLVPIFNDEMKPYEPQKNRVRDFYRDAIKLTNTVSASGGNEKTNYHFSYNNTDAQGIMPDHNLKRNILNLGLNINPSKNLTVQLNANYSKEKVINPPVLAQQNWVLPTALMTLGTSTDIRWLKPESGYMTPQGDEIGISRFTGRINPYWIVNKREMETIRDRLFGNVTVRYQLMPWLYVQGRIGQDYFNRTQTELFPTGTRSSGAPQNAEGTYSGSYYQGKSTFREMNMDFLIGGNGKFGNFGIDAMFGGSRMDRENESLATQVDRFFIRDLYIISNGVTKNPTFSYSHKRINSLYGSLELSYNNYLFLNAAARNDWFSTLNPESNNYLYPSVSTSFVFSQAFNSAMPQWLDFGKIRVAYAEVGGDTNPYGNSLYYSLNANQFPVGTSMIGYGSISGNTNPNPNLRPLKIKEFETGFELRTFKQRVSIDVSFYNKLSTDEILSVTISQSSGYNSDRVNVGELRNKGVEMLLTLVPVDEPNFMWESSFTFAINNSEVLKLAGNQTQLDVAATAEFIGLLSHEVGKPLASLRGIDYRRDDQGRIITINGRFQIGNVISYGSAIPTHTGGWINNFTYKGITLFAQIDFKAGHKLISNSEFNYHRHGLSKASLVGREGGVVFDGYNLDGTPNTTPVPADVFYADYRNVNTATPFVYDASFIRFRTISLGYDFTKLVNLPIFRGITANAFVNNVGYILKRTDNIDPESQWSTSDNQTGIEFHGLPPARNYGLNIVLKF